MRVLLKFKPKRRLPPKQRTRNRRPIFLHILQLRIRIFPRRGPPRLRDPHGRLPRAILHALQGLLEILPRRVNGRLAPEGEDVDADEVCVVERGVAVCVGVADGRGGCEELGPGLLLQPVFDVGDVGGYLVGGGGHGAGAAFFAGAVVAAWGGRSLAVFLG